MTVFLRTDTLSDIETEIMQHPAWLGYVSGLKAEKLLRGKKTPYLYVLRAGENHLDYYVTFVRRDGAIEHRPFSITLSSEGWSYENLGGGGPYREASIEDVLHRIMHCDQGDNVPFINFERVCL